MSLLEVAHVSKKNGSDFLLNDISFSQESGQKIAIAGETGSGKTTLAKIVAGYGQADSGTVHFEGQRVWGTEEKLLPGHKGIAYLSQYFELRNNYQVAELLAYANNLTEEASGNLYRMCRIDQLLHRWTQTLSGGEKQRVALARLLTEKPRLLVLDEPYSNLDLMHKLQLKEVVRDLNEQLQLSCILVSHDADDILPWADELFVMKDGQITEQGTPQQLYRNSRHLYTAGLLGRYTSLSLSLAEVLQVPLPQQLYLRPDELTTTTDGAPATVLRCDYMGSHYEVTVALSGANVIVNTSEKLPIGSTTFITSRPDAKR